MDQTKPFISFVQKLLLSSNPEAAPSNAVFHFFKRENYFSCYCHQAEYAAKHFFETSNVIRFEGVLSFVRCNCTLFQKMVAFLLSRNIDILIWKRQDSGKWESGKLITPGNRAHIENELGVTIGDASLSPTVASIYLCTSTFVVGMCLVSTTFGKFTIFEFQDDDCFSRYYM